jgi:hypothetical protein
MKKYIVVLTALLFIMAMASPLWAGQGQRDDSWLVGFYQFICRIRYELAIKSPWAFRGLIKAAERSPVIDLLPTNQDPGDGSKEDPVNDKKDPTQKDPGALPGQGAKVPPGQLRLK